MCLILFAIDSHPRYPLIVGANRDEFHERPTRTMRPWPEAPELLAGMDQRSGGTWMGLSRRGRFAAVTNVRGEAPGPGKPRSRGELPLNFLLGGQGAADYAQQAHLAGRHYAGFNLLVGDRSGFYYCSNRNGRAALRLAAGIYGLSNEALDTAWPKVEIGKGELRELLRGEPDPADVLTVMQDAEPAQDHLLPDTGVGLERERLLSSRFIKSHEYGTRSSTALLIDSAGLATVWEQNFGPGAQPGDLFRYEWPLEAIPR